MMTRNQTRTWKRTFAATAFALLAAGGLSAATASAASAEWPGFRGAQHDDLSKDTGLLKSWPDSGPPLAWSAKGIGNGYGSVSVAGGAIYTTGDRAEGDFVHALGLDGKILWSTRIGKPGDVNRPGARGTPTYDDGKLYTLAPHGELACLDAKTGKEIWHKDLVADFGGKQPGWAYAESPLVDGDHVICTPGGPKGTLVALDKKTGETVWQSGEWTDTAQYSSPIVVDLGGVHQYIQLTGASVAGVAADSGKLLWKAARPGKTATIPSPVYHDGYVYVTSGYGVGCDLFKVNKSAAGFTADPVYTDNKTMVNHHGGVILLDGKLYGYSDKGGWTCQDMLSGKALWTDKTLGKGSIAYADGHFYLREEGGEKGQDSRIALIEATPEGFKKTGMFTQPQRSGPAAWPHPVIVDGRLYIRDQDVLLCYDVKAK